MANAYRVLISGQTLTGVPLSSIKADVAEVFPLEEAQIARMLSGKPMVVSSRATADAAERLVARLRSVGLEARAEMLAEAPREPPFAPQATAGVPPSAASEELFALVGPAPTVQSAAAGGHRDTPPAENVSCPKCGEFQPKRTLCRACGLDMPRYLAAQEAAEREAREARAAELEARRAGGGRTAHVPDAAEAALFGLGFGGRFGRLDYFSASLVSILLWMGFAWLAVVAGKPAFIGFGLLLSSVFALRGIALRLHDTGRTGWLALVAIVPLIGALMMLALLFIGGDEDSNEYGPARGEAGGARAFLALMAVIMVSVLSFRSMQDSPEKMLRFAEVMSFGPGPGAMADASDAEAFPGEPVRYARSNRIDIYVVAGCSDCDDMLGWLHSNDLTPSVYRVDSDGQAAERLQSILGGGGRILLPVLEINGKVLSPNPDVAEVHEHLRLASP